MKLYSNIVKNLTVKSFPMRINWSWIGLGTLISGYIISTVGGVLYPQTMWVKDAYIFGVGISGVIMLFTIYRMIKSPRW